MEGITAMGQHRATARERKESRGKQNLYLPLIGLVVLIAAASIFIGVYAFAPNFERNISTIETTTQNTDGASSTNYIPILAENIDWDSLSEGDRTGTARYAVNAAIAKAQTDGTTIFSVMGLRHDSRQPVFLYTGGESVVLYVGEETVRVALNG